MEALAKTHSKVRVKVGLRIMVKDKILDLQCELSIKEADIGKLH